MNNSQKLREVAKSYSPKEHIMDVAQELAQTCGINAFSYKNIAEEIGIRTPSIHYHFPRKDDLYNAIMQRYSGLTTELLSELDNTIASPKQRFSTYLDISLSTSGDGEKICLCAMYVSDFSTLSTVNQEVVKKYIRMNESWIAKTLEEAKQKEQLAQDVNSDIVAKLTFSTLQGLHVTTRAFKGEKRNEGLIEQVIKNMAFL